MAFTLNEVETPNAPKAIGPYSQAVTDGNYVFVSGQLPVDPKTGKLVEGDIHLQTQRALENLEAILEASGCSLFDVVRVEVFLKDLNEFKGMNEEYSKHFTSNVPPARQTIQVAKLPLDAPIEISCIARLPQE